MSQNANVGRAQDHSNYLQCQKPACKRQNRPFGRFCASCGVPLEKPPIWGMAGGTPSRARMADSSLNGYQSKGPPVGWTQEKPLEAPWERLRSCWV